MTADQQLLDQARSPDPDARQKAAYLVSQSASEREYPLMFELLGDKDWRVRKTIVDGFVRDPQHDIIERLLDTLGDEENAGRRNSATEALVRIGEKAIPAIVARFQKAMSVDVRLALINLLGDLRSAEGLAMLLETVQSERDVNIASAMVAAIGKYRDSSALPYLIAIIRRVGASGKSVVLSSHVLHEVEAVTPRVVLINRGRLVAEGHVREIRDLIDKHPHRIVLRGEDDRALAAKLIAFDDVVGVDLGRADGGIVVETRSPDAFYGRLARIALEDGTAVTHVESEDDNLDAVFRYLVNP